MQICCGLLSVFESFDDELKILELSFLLEVLELSLFFDEPLELFLLPDVELFLSELKSLSESFKDEELLSSFFALTLTINSFIDSFPALSLAITLTLYSPTFEVSNFEESIK